LVLGHPTPLAGDGRKTERRRCAWAAVADNLHLTGVITLPSIVAVEGCCCGERLRRRANRWRCGRDYDNATPLGGFAVRHGRAPSEDLRARRAVVERLQKRVVLARSRVTWRIS
jgi:hypothetical protein